MLKVRAAAISAAAIIGFAVFASAQVPAKVDSTWRRGDRQGQMGQMGQMGPRGERGRFGRGHGRGFGPDGQGGFVKDLNLTDAQKSKIKSIHEKYRAQFEAIRKQEQSEVRGTLTADQRTKWDAAQKQRDARMAAMKKRFEERRDARQGKTKS